MRRNLVQLTRQVYDVLVIGGGIYGLWVACDAARRGLSVALLEQGDFGHATSSQSLRVIHGGLRYLQYGDIRRMRQSIYERSVLMRVAPHLVHPLPFLIPTYGHGLRGRSALALALAVHDSVGYDRNRQLEASRRLPRGRVISRQECLRLFPGVEERDLSGGAIFYDCQMSSSERLLLAIAHSAATAGGDLANYVEVTGLLCEGTHVVGVRAKDRLTGDELESRARVVVNATGPWLERVLQRLPGYQPQRPRLLSKAFNVLLTRQLVPHYAVGIYSKGSYYDRDALLSKKARLFFITPWHDRSLIGTEHLPYATDPEDCRVTEEELERFLKELTAAYPAFVLRRQDVAHVYSGLLPAASYEAGEVQLVKHPRLYDHRRAENLAGLISVSGVKFTEARHVAAKAVDLVCDQLGKTSRGCTTAVVPLHGGQIEDYESFRIQAVQRRPQSASADILCHLVSQYGAAYQEVLRHCDTDPAALCPISKASRVTAAEVRYAVREEMAQTLADVVFRRTALSLTGCLEKAALRSCAAIMARALGWDTARTQREVEEVQAACWP